MPTEALTDTAVSGAPVGAGERETGRRSPRGRRLLVLLLVTVSTVGCSGDDAPETLFDLSSPASLPVELQGLDEQAVLTRVETVALETVDDASPIQSCIGVFEGDGEPSSPLVSRVGVHTETVTFGEVSGEWLYGCDNSSGPRADDRRWCGVAAGRLYGGTLRDPRIDIGCKTASDDDVAFAWVHPKPPVRYVVVDQPGYAEVYEVVDELPVRIATVTDIEESRARFRLSEYDAQGRLMRSYELEAGVAG